MIKIETIINNLKVNYIKKGNGKTVLLIPGWGTVINTYYTLIESISSYSTIYCLDMPGFGNTDEPKNTWNLDDYIDFIIHFIEQQNIKELDLIGHSNGGRIIIKLMNRKNLNFKVNKIILIGCAGIVNKNILKKLKIISFKFCKNILSTKLISRAFPDLLDNFKNKFGSEDFRNASPIMRNHIIKLINEDSRPYLSNIHVPTLLLWGENDTATPIKDGKIMEKLIPDCGLVSIPNCTHYVFLEQPFYINKIIYTFLKGENS